MIVVVDTNIIFSALLRENSILGEILLLDDFDFVMPKYAYIELFKYKEKIIKYSKYSEEELLEVLYRLLKNIRVFDEEMITTETLKNAYKLVKDLDENDLLFVALAIDLDGMLWTGDKKLINGLKDRGFQKLFSHNDYLGRY